MKFESDGASSTFWCSNKWHWQLLKEAVRGLPLTLNPLIMLNHCYVINHQMPQEMVQI